MLCDKDRAALKQIWDAGQTKRSKHVNMLHHFDSHSIAQDEIGFAYLPSEENVADCFTEPVGVDLLMMCRIGMGLVICLSVVGGMFRY
jgi:hypothetical protein